MKRVLASLGLGAVIVGGMIHPAIAEDSQRIHAEITKTTSASRQTSSEVTVAGTWSVDKLAVGQFFTVTADPNPANGEIPFAWSSSFPFTLNDGTKIGECDATHMTITCKVTEVPAAYADKTDVKGTWWARARIQDAAVGTTEGTIILNGKADKKIVWGDAKGTGVCTSDCDGPAHYEYAKPENIKFGWSNDNGTIGWGIKWIANGGTEYTVKDFDTQLNTDVKCAKGDTWDPATTERVTATQVDDNTIKFVAPEGSKTCVVYPPEQMQVPEGQTSVTNHAEINGMKLEATATVKSNGGTNGDGSVKPEPAPKPSESTPDPKPSESTPAPKPSETTPAPKPSTTTPAPKPSVTTPAPKPSATTPAPKQNVAPATPKTSEQPKLAKTGSSAASAGVLAMLLALLGIGIYSISRKETK